MLESLGDSAAAASAYEVVLNKDAPKVQTFIMLASLYAREGDFEKAIGVLKRLNKMYPQESLGEYYLGRVYEQAGDMVRATKFLRAAFTADPANEEYLSQLLRVLLKNKDTAAAKGIADDVVKRDPENVIARRVLSQLSLSLNDIDDALTHLKILEDTEDDPSSTRLKIALLHLSRNDFDQAVTELQLIIASNPELGVAHYYLASIYAGAGRNEDAVSEIDKISKQDQIFAKAQAFSAYVQKQAGNLNGAEASAKLALEAAPGDLQVTAYLALILREEKKFAEALKVTDAGIEKIGNDERLLYHRALILHELNREVEAVAAMEKVLTVNPKNSDALNYVAYALAEDGTDLPRALKLIQAAILVRPDDPYYLDTLGWVFFRNGQLDEANKVLLRAVEKSEGDPLILEHLGDLLIAKGQLEEGNKVYADAAQKLQGNEKEVEEARKRIRAKLQHER